MKILHTSDWHLGKCMEKIDRYNEQIEFINEIEQIANKNSIDIILITGDIYDTYNPSAQSEHMFYDAIKRLNNKGERAIIVIAGNHDSPERLNAVNTLVNKDGIYIIGYPGFCAEKNNKGKIRIINSGTGWFEIEMDSCNEKAVIITLPYPSEQRLDEIISNNFTEEHLQEAYSKKIGKLLKKAAGNFRYDTVNIIASHLYVTGGRETGVERPIQLGGALTVDASVFPNNTHYVALGHLHRPQKIRGSKVEIRYSGSPLAYSFNEADYSKAVNIVEVKRPDMLVDIKEIYLSSGCKLKKWTAKNGIEEALKWCVEGKDKGAWIDLEIYTDRIITTEEQKELRRLNNRIVNIRPVIINNQEEKIDYEKRETKNIEQLFIEFYKHRTGTEIDEELLELFLKIAESERGEEFETQIS